jgi:hypothetical protein
MEQVEEPLFDLLLRPADHLRAQLLAHHRDADLGEIADDRLDVAADVAHLRELGRLDFDERSAGEPRQPAGDLGLAHAGGADHQDVVREDLLPQPLRHP